MSDNSNLLSASNFNSDLDANIKNKIAHKSANLDDVKLDSQFFDTDFFVNFPQKIFVQDQPIKNMMNNIKMIDIKSEIKSH